MPKKPTAFTPATKTKSPVMKTKVPNATPTLNKIGKPKKLSPRKPSLKGF